MATGARVDPYRQHHFIVEIDGITQAGFTECLRHLGSSDGPPSSTGRAAIATVRKLPGLTKYHEHHPEMGADRLRASCMTGTATSRKGKIKRKNGTIILNDMDGAEVARWNFYDAWPTKWDGPDFSANGTNVASCETLEICARRIERA